MHMTFTLRSSGTRFILPSCSAKSRASSAYCRQTARQSKPNCVRLSVTVQGLRSLFLQRALRPGARQRRRFHLPVPAADGPRRGFGSQPQPLSLALQSLLPSRMLPSRTFANAWRRRQRALRQRALSCSHGRRPALLQSGRRLVRGSMPFSERSIRSARQGPFRRDQRISLAGAYAPCLLRSRAVEDCATLCSAHIWIDFAAQRLSEAEANAVEAAVAASCGTTAASWWRGSLNPAENSEEEVRATKTTCCCTTRCHVTFATHRRFACIASNEDAPKANALRSERLAGGGCQGNCRSCPFRM